MPIGDHGIAAHRLTRPALSGVYGRPFDLGRPDWPKDPFQIRQNDRFVGWMEKRSLPTPRRCSTNFRRSGTHQYAAVQESAYGYNLPSEPLPWHVWNDPNSGPSNANVWNPAVCVRTTPRSGIAGCYQRRASFDPMRSSKQVRGWMDGLRTANLVV